MAKIAKVSQLFTNVSQKCHNRDRKAKATNKATRNLHGNKYKREKARRLYRVTHQVVQNLPLTLI